MFSASEKYRALMFPTPCTFCLWWDGLTAKAIYKKLASMVATKHNQSYSQTISWLQCRFSFSLLCSSIMCLRGSCFSLKPQLIGHRVKHVHQLVPVRLSFSLLLSSIMCLRGSYNRSLSEKGDNTKSKSIMNTSNIPLKLRWVKSSSVTEGFKLCWRTGQKLTLRPSFLEKKRAYVQCIREVEHWCFPPSRTFCLLMTLSLVGWDPWPKPFIRS